MQDLASEHQHPAGRVLSAGGYHPARAQAQALGCLRGRKHPSVGTQTLVRGQKKNY